MGKELGLFYTQGQGAWRMANGGPKGTNLEKKDWPVLHKNRYEVLGPPKKEDQVVIDIDETGDSSVGLEMAGVSKRKRKRVITR